jgi:hypothetical protein
MTPQPLPVDELDGYRSHYNDLDADVAVRNKCQICGTATEYRGFFHAANHSYRAFAVCLNPRCGHAVEF